MVDNSLSFSTAAAQDARERQGATSRLRGNANADRLDIDETVRVMERLGSDAAVLQKENKAGFKALYKNFHLGAVAAGHLAASAADSSMEDATSCSDGHDKDDDLSTSGDDEEAVLGLGGKGKGRARSGMSSTEHKMTKAMRAHRSGRQSRTARYASAVAKGQRRFFTTKKKGTKGKAVGAEIMATIDVDSYATATAPSSEERVRGWPLATRHRFEKNLPAFVSPQFGGAPPVRIAHAAAAELYQFRVDEIDADMGGLIVKGATDKQVRGYMLTSGTMCAAQVSEWLCSAMPEALRSATLPNMAYAVQQMVAKEAATAAAASGVGVAPAPAVLGRVAAVPAMCEPAGAPTGAAATAPGHLPAAALAATVVTAASPVDAFAGTQAEAALDPSGRTVAHASAPEHAAQPEESDEL